MCVFLASVQWWSRA